MIEAALADDRERVDQPLEVLVWLDVARVEHELVGQLVTLAHAHHVLFGRLHREALVVGVVNDVDLVRLGVHEAQDVALRALRHGHHPRRMLRRLGDRPSGVGQRGPVRQVLREHQVDAVVDRHDRPALDERRQHVMGRVKQRDPLALQRPGNPDLFRDRIIAGRLRDRPEVFSNRRQRLAILWTAEEDEFGLAVEARQMPEQVPDVGADAEVVQLSGVYADPHWLHSTQATGPSLGIRGGCGAARLDVCRERRRRRAPPRRRRARRRESGQRLS